MLLLLHVILLLQPKEARAGDASDNFARIARFTKRGGGGDEEAATDDEGGRKLLWSVTIPADAHSTGRMLLEPKEPTEVRVPVGWLACRVVGIDALTAD